LIWNIKFQKIKLGGLNMSTIKKRWTALVLVLLLVVSIFAGCGSSPQPSDSTDSSPKGEGKSEDTTSEDENDEPPSAPASGNFHRYDPPITATFGYPHDVNADGIVAMEKAGEPLENNRWVKYFRDKVGVESVYKLMAVGPDYDQKLLMAMSAGDLPDIFWVSDLSMLKQLVEAEQVVDLTDIYKQHANPTLTDLIEYEGEEIFNPVTFNGRRYAIPVKMPSTNEYNHCWVRQDWLDKLKLDRPTTMDEVMEVARAFKEKDPDGNGKDDTIGLMLNKDYIAESKGIFWAFGGKTARRKHWTTLDDGSVVFSEVQPEMKGGLKWLRDMYSQELINQEFATQDISKAFEYVADNKCGLFFAPHWYGFRLYAAESSMDEGADWVAIGLPTGTDQPTKVYGTNTFDAVTCVNANYEYPEAVVHLHNAYAEKLFGEENDFDNFFSCPENDGCWSTAPLHVLHPLVDLVPHRDIKEALKNGTTDQLTGGGKSFWKYITSGQSSYDYMFGPEDSCFNFVDDTYPDIIEWNAYFGAPTETWAERWSSLQELIDTTYLKIIQGNIDLDSGFDNMVEEWHNLGGEKITEEVNAIVETYDK
jgi:putative aldouronate transport system substrate-binding protein